MHIAWKSIRLLFETTKYVHVVVDNACGMTWKWFPAWTNELFYESRLTISNGRYFTIHFWFGPLMCYGVKTE